MSQPEGASETRFPEYGTPYAPSHTTEEQPARLGPGQRLIGVLLSPGETFQDINRKPTWLAPMLIAIIVGVSSSLFLNWRVNPDWNRITRDMIRSQANKTGQDIPEQAIERQVKMFQTLGKITPLLVIVATPIVLLILSGMYALGMMLMQAQTTFKKILSVVAWTLCAIGLVNAVVNSAALMVRDRESLDAINPRQPGTVSATNLSPLLESNASPVLKSLAGSLDLFSVWMLILMAIGLAAIGGSRKITPKKTGAMVVSLWLIWVLLLALGALAFPQ